MTSPFKPPDTKTASPDDWSMNSTISLVIYADKERWTWTAAPDDFFLAIPTNLVVLAIHLEVIPHREDRLFIFLAKPKKLVDSD